MICFFCKTSLAGAMPVRLETGKIVWACDLCHLEQEGTFFAEKPNTMHCLKGHPIDNPNGFIGWKHCHICKPPAIRAIPSCKMCGKKFEYNNKRGFIPDFCSNACKQKHYRQKKVVTRERG